MKHGRGIDAGKLSLDSRAQASAQRVANQKSAGQYGRTNGHTQHDREIAAPVVSEVPDNQTGKSEHVGSSDS